MALSLSLSCLALCSWLTSSLINLTPRPRRHSTHPTRSAPSARRSSPSKAPSQPPTSGRAQASRTSNARLARTSSSRPNLATRPTRPRPPLKLRLHKYRMGKGREPLKPEQRPRRGHWTSRGEREAQSPSAKSAKPSSPDQAQSSAKVRSPPACLHRPLKNANSPPTGPPRRQVAPTKKVRIPPFISDLCLLIRNR